MGNRFKVFVLTVLLTLAVAGCGGSSSGSGGGGGSSSAGGGSAPRSVTIRSAKVGGLGTVLVNSSGYVLYMFQPDNASKVACNSDCQSVWPPEVAPAHGKAKAGPGVKQSLIGSLPNPVTGGRIVTYAGWPLYTYVADHAPDQATGQNIDLNGGYWWVISPDGKIVR